MPDVYTRIANLPPARRELLERLLKDKAAPQRREQGKPKGELVLEVGSSPAETKAAYRRFYNAVSEHLNATVFGDFAFFLNYGYVPDRNPQYSRVELPGQYLNRNSVRLVLELVGDCDTAGKRILDVGCGRGGTVSVIRKYFSPRSIIGIDLSSAAIAFCDKAHRQTAVSFLEADAEALPFQKESFEIVTSVESSHSYPDIEKFYNEVFRVLITGGYFLYTDVMPVARMKECTDMLQQIGFYVERTRDITTNVLLSCDQLANARMGAFDQERNSGTMPEFLALPGSDAYEEMRQRVSIYNMFKLRRRSNTGGRRIQRGTGIAP